MKRSRRDFMRQLLGGGAAALVGVTIPVGLRSDEMALVGERVFYELKGDVLTVTNLTRHPVEVYATTFGTVRYPEGDYQIDSAGVRAIREGGEQMDSAEVQALLDGWPNLLGNHHHIPGGNWVRVPEGELVLTLGDSFHRKALAS